MEYLEVWLGMSGFGILVGLFPAWILFAGHIASAIVQERAEVPRWMFRLAGGDPNTGYINKGVLPVHFAHIPNKVLCAIMAIVILGIMHYVILDGFATSFSNKVLIDIIMLETSFTLFFLLTILLPAYILERFLRQQESKGKNRTD
jgi:hypothetical protein